MKKKYASLNIKDGGMELTVEMEVENGDVLDILDQCQECLKKYCPYGADLTSIYFYEVDNGL